MKKIISKLKEIHLTYGYVIYSLILLLGLFVRLYKISTPLADWHSFRQVDTASVSRLYLENGINLLFPKYHDISRVQSGIFNPEGYRFVEFPLYNAFVTVLVKLLPLFTLETWGRLLSIYFSLLSSILIYKITFSIFGKIEALFALGLYLFLPYNIFFSRVFLPEPAAVFYTLTFLYLFLCYQRSRNLSLLIFSAISLSLAVLTKPYVIVFGLPAAYYFYQSLKLKGLIKSLNVWIFSLIILIPFFLWRFWISRFPEGIPFWKWVFNGDGIRLHPAYWYWLYGERIGKLILGVWGVIPLFVGAVSLRKKDGFMISLLTASIFYLLVIATANVRHDYYQILIVPYIVIIMSYGLRLLYDLLVKINSKNKVLISIFLMLLLSLVISAFQVKEYYKINHPEIISAGNAVDRLAPSEARVIASYNGDTAFLYFTKRSGWPVVELPIAQLIEEGAEYYASVNLSDPQTKEFMNRFEILEKTDTYVVLKLQ